MPSQGSIFMLVFNGNYFLAIVKNPKGALSLILLYLGKNFDKIKSEKMQNFLIKFLKMAKGMAPPIS